jgi:hypothetical protein
MLATIALLPLIMHVPELFGWLSANPIYWMSHLAPGPPGRTLLIRGFPGWVDGNAGVTTQALGRLSADDWLHGIVPWWNHFSGVGLPLAAEMQCSALFLPFVLLLHFDDGVLYLKIIIQILTGICMWALLRQLGIGRRAALVGAVLAEFNGTFAWFSHAPIMPVAFLPLLLLGIEWCREPAHEGKAGGWLLIAIAIAFSVIAGFPETAYLDGLLGLAWALYRVATFGPGRLRLAAKVAMGGATGVLLSAPAWLAFLEFLPRAYLSTHADQSSAALLPGNYAMLLLPYIYGPLLYGPEMFGQQADLWWHNGGYCDLLLIFLAILALLHQGGRERGLRWLLASWCVVTFAKAGGQPLFSGVLNLLPLIKQTMFHVYITPSWEIGLIILASLALDDWHRGRFPAASRLWLAASLCGGAAAAALLLGRSDIALLAHHVPGYWLFPVGSAGLAMLGLTATMILMTRAPGVHRSTALCGIVTGSGLLLFGLPLLSGTRDARLDLRPVAFLRDRLGLSRVASMGVLQPNYGAYFGIATVNHIYLPVPQSWVDYIHAHLSRSVDGVTFFGETLTPAGPGDDAFADAIASPILTEDALRTYEALGVRYVLARSGTDPFTDSFGPPLSRADHRPLRLTNGQAVSVSFPAGWFKDGAVHGAGLQIGTYGDTADGILQISVCSGDSCAGGNVYATRTVDNSLSWVAFDPALRVRADKPLYLNVSYHAATHPVAVWLWPTQSTVKAAVSGPDGARNDGVPLFSLRYQTGGPQPNLVYRDKTIDIYELASPAAYFSTASGHCKLQPMSRDTVSAVCTEADRLIRRELFFPGWTANIDATSANLLPYGSIFQSITLPKGSFSIKFSYRPPYAGWAFSAMCLGFLTMAAALWRTRGKRHEPI